jgi:hypothetical protein
MKMNVNRKEIVAAVILGVLIILPVFYLKMQNDSLSRQARGTFSLNLQGLTEQSVSVSETQQKRVSETIEGEIERGAFELVVNKLEALTDETGGYVKSLQMTYQDQAWSCYMICNIPSLNVTSFTFGGRAIIDDNGTVTYINIDVEYLEEPQQGQENASSTVNFNLIEVKPESTVELGASLGPILAILTTSLSWTAQGVIIGLPLCFASLGIVILVSRGLIPLWKNVLKKPKQRCLD